MSSTDKLGEDYLRVPRLDVSGSNWIIYKDRLQFAADARGYLDHLDGSKTSPIAPVSPTPLLSSPAPDPKAIAAYEADEKKYKEDLVTFEKDETKWKRGEGIMKQLIAGTIPDSLFIKLRHQTNARNMWLALGSEFQNKSRMVSVDLRRRLQDVRCGEKDDLQTHFLKLRTMRENLAAMGHPPADDDFYAIILGSLPPSFEPYISAVTATSAVLGTTLSAEDLMLTLTEEYERRLLRSKNTPSRKEDTGDAAFTAAEKGKGRSKRNIECFNCKKKGHVKAECWAPGGGKEGQGPRKGKSKDTAAAAKEEETSADFAWMANAEANVLEGLSSTTGMEPLSVDDYDEWYPEDCASTASSDSIPSLDTVSEDSEDTETDWPHVSNVPDSAEGNIEDVEGAAYTLTFEHALLAKESSAACEFETELYDSGASRHMSPYHHRFLNFQSITPKPIGAADNRTFKAIGKGDMYVDVPNGETTSRVLLTDVLYAPDMGVTLISISRIDASGSSILFKSGKCCLYNPVDDLVGEIPVVDGLYCVYHPKHIDYAGQVKDVLTVEELHRRMGHISYDAARHLIKKGLIIGVVLDDTPPAGPCAVCDAAKATRKPIRKEREGERAAAVGGEVHSDVWGPSPVETLKGRRYYVSFTDDHSRWTVIYLMRTKDEVFRHYQSFEALMETQYGTKVKILHSDRGGEYLSTEFSNHLAKQGTQRRLTVHDTPEYNGLAERLNRTLITKVQALLLDSGLPKALWGEAAMHAVFLKNRSPTRALSDTTPHEAFLKRKPNLAELHRWGSQMSVHDPSRTKLEARASVGHWVGFDEQSHAHHVYWLHRRSVTVERSLRFDDTVDPVFADVPLEGERALEDPGGPDSTGTPTNTSNRPKNHQETAETSPEPLISPSPGSPDVLGPIFEEIPSEGRGKHVRKPSDYVRRLRGGEGSVDGKGDGNNLPKGMPVVAEGDTAGLAWVTKVDVEELAMAAVMGDAEGLQPTLEEARKRPDWAKWLAAIKAELESLIRNDTWTWVLRIKKDATGAIDKYKARLVAQGFTQVYGVDYFETFAPVAKIASIRLVLAITARDGWEVQSFDFNSAYLNSVLNDDKEIYLEQPPQFPLKDPKLHVLRLKKALYGLKQGGRKWYEHLCIALADLGFKRAEADYCVFYTKVGESLVLLAIHVDDCIITGNSSTLISQYKRQLGDKYSLTDLGPVSWLLGIKVTRDLEARTLSLSQHAYIDSILARFNFTDLKPSSIPMDPNIQFLKSQCPMSLVDIARMRKIPYREAIGSLMYAAVGTRPDISFAVSTLAQFSHNPGWIHWEAVK
ncbi:hypothetical protein PHLCEN_2v5279 [Hermanssonia centrifuga]|uniref:Polyprotein n=1 Tax=Hermanssonia centrifuga TaxID=98765 RepID=A0A2R6P8J7_9APHY|nr:hypothetical protein PHLCEN_2v5279 [Hermanssonia centrifuga]